MPKVRTIAAAAGLAALAAVLTPAALAQMSTQDQAQEVKVELRKPKVTLIKMHADWCPFCRALEGPWEAAQRDLVGEDILFVRLDRTDKATSRQSAFHLAALDLESIWTEYGNKTGTMVLVDTESGKVLKAFNGRTAGSSVTADIREHL
ncbi:MAG: thioredoxin domain-containing protein [Planctomycetota bacterium]